jgi:hypothetical protein
MPIAPNDSVRQCAEAIRNLLARLNLGTDSPAATYFLANGKIEKALKTFIGTAWIEANVASRAYAMDKRPFDGCEMDLLAFEHAAPIFFIETKCSFAEDPRDVWAAALRALSQTDTLYTNLGANPGELADGFLACHAYIIHFLNSVPKPEDPLLPPWLRARYPQGDPVKPTELESFYRKNMSRRYHSSDVISVWTTPDVYAVVVKLNPGLIP